MNRLLAFMLLTSSTIGVAQTPQIKSGSTVYIEPMDGYETYLAAAFVKKQVPLAVVADRKKAAYIIKSTVSSVAPTSPAVVINNTNGDNNKNDAFDSGFQAGISRRARNGMTSASISVIDAESSQVVFAYSVGKGRDTNQTQSTAEACAKHLREFIEKSEKPKR